MRCGGRARGARGADDDTVRGGDFGDCIDGGDVCDSIVGRGSGGGDSGDDVDGCGAVSASPRAIDTCEHMEART